MLQNCVNKFLRLLKAKIIHLQKKPIYLPRTLPTLCIYYQRLTEIIRKVISAGILYQFYSSELDVEICITISPNLFDGVDTSILFPEQRLSGRALAYFTGCLGSTPGRHTRPAITWRRNQDSRQSTLVKRHMPVLLTSWSLARQRDTKKSICCQKQTKT